MKVFNIKYIKKCLIGLAIFFAIFTIFGFFVFPPILKSILIKKISEKIHREVTIDKIKVNPYLLSATVRGFKVKERKGSGVFLSFDELYLNLQSLSAIKRVIIVKEIKLINPFIKIDRYKDLSYNFSDLIPKKESKKEEKAKPLRFSLNNIQIINGNIDFWDEPKGKKHTVRELNIAVPFLSNLPYYIEIFVQPKFSAKINDTFYSISGKTKPFSESFETTVDLTIKDLDVPNYLTYLPLKLNFILVSTYLDIKTNLSFIQHKNKVPSLIVSGSISIKNVVMNDIKGKPIFRIPLIEVGIAPTEPLRRFFHLSKLSIQSPEIDIQRDSKGVLNIESVLSKKIEAKTPSPNEKKGGQAYLSINIDYIELNGGKLSFSDQSRPKPFRTKIDSIELKINNFSNELNKKPSYLFSFKTERNEVIRLAGNFSINPIWVKGLLEAKSLYIKKYSPYYMENILFDIDDGKLDLLTNYQYEKDKDEPKILLSGISGTLSSLRLRKKGEDNDFFKAPVISLKDTQLDFTQKEIKIGSFFTEKGILILNRLKNGDFDLVKLLPSPSKKEFGKNHSIKGREKSWSITIEKFLLDKYNVKMTDFSTPVPNILLGENIRFSGENLTTMKNVKGKFYLSLLLDKKGYISTKGTIGIDPINIDGSLDIRNIALKNYLIYIHERVLFDIEEGEAVILANYIFKKTDKEQELKISKGSISLSNLMLKKRDEEKSFVFLPIFLINNLNLNLTAQELSIGEISTQMGSLLIRRYNDGKLNLQTLLVESQKPVEISHQEAEKVSEVRPDKKWLVNVGKIVLERYKVKFVDEMTSEPVDITAEDINLIAENVSNKENSKGKLSLSLLLNNKGRISTSGTIALNPVDANLNMEIKDLEIRPFQAYFTDKVKITVTEGSISTAGNLSIKISEERDIKFNYKGEATLSRFASIDKINGDDFLKWSSLSFNDLNIGYSPILVDIKGISLTDFYARIIINPDGKLNIQDILKKEVPKEDKKQKEEGVASSKDKKIERNIKIDTITLQGGTIEFTDRSIKPEYSSKLVEILGRVSGLSSEETVFGDLDLRAKLDNYAPLEITGKLNPLREDLYVDLKVRFKDMDLSPMTPYSGKYVGYTIEKGKLSFDLEYQIDKRKLNAKNYIFLDQFNFGEKVESPHATKLPVKLAIALLKDRKGEIKLDIPVRGSLDDPKFSIGRIILQIIINLITKAVTSPFALIGAIFGGGEELSYLEFDYGSNLLTENNSKKIETLIKVLYERPSLKIDIAGYVDLERDRDGLKQYFFQRKLKFQKLKEMIKKGQPAIAVDDVKIEPTEYEKYLTMAYKEEKFPKPRNILGIPKKLPVPEMEKLILTHIEIKESDLRNLAIQRATKVKDAILKSGKIEPERIFIIESRSLEPEKKENLKNSRVELKIK